MAGVRLAAPSPAAPSLAAFPLPLCRTAPDKEEYGSEPGRFTSDSSRAVFQRTRELEDKLEAQRRHLKELEEKVGGRAGFGPPSGAVSVESFLLPARNAPRAASVQPPHPIVCPSAPHRHIRNTSNRFEHLSREEAPSGINFVRGVWGDVFDFHKRPSLNPPPPPH